MNASSSGERLNRLSFRRALAVIAPLLAAASPSWADAPFAPWDGPDPIAVWHVFSVWSSHGPSLVVYEDGEVLYRKGGDLHSEYLHRRLDADALRAVKDRLAATDLSDVKSWYDLAPGVTDMPTTFLYVKAAGRVRKIRLYGMSAKGTLLASTRYPTDVKPEAVPDQVGELREYLRSLTLPDGVPWTPRYIEVSLQPYEYAPDASIHWPKKWPGLRSSRTTKDEYGYSIYLDWQQHEELSAFLRSRKEKGAIVIDGRKWSASLNWVIPREPDWARGALADPD